MFAELQGMIDNSIVYIEELLGAQQTPTESACAHTAWLKRIIEVTWIQNPQNAYNFIAIIVAFAVIATGIHLGWKQLNSIKTRRSRSPSLPVAETKADQPSPSSAPETKTTRASSRRPAARKTDTQATAQRAPSSSRSRSASAKPNTRPKRAAAKGRN